MSVCSWRSLIKSLICLCVVRTSLSLCYQLNWSRSLHGASEQQRTA